MVVRTMEATEERTKSGIYLPKSADEKKQGIVAEVGTFKEGQPLPLKKGDKVLYGGYSSEDIEVDGVKHLIIEFKDIVAKLED